MDFSESVGLAASLMQDVIDASQNHDSNQQDNHVVEAEILPPEAVKRLNYDENLMSHRLSTESIISSKISSQIYLRVSYLILSWYQSYRYII